MAGSPNKNPQFFKVFLPKYCSHELKICSSFKTHLGREVGGNAIITRSATNQKWNVDLVMVDGDFFFGKGWNEFVTNNGITEGEFMVFQYHGKSRFSVDIFGTNCLLKVTPAKHNFIFGDENDGDDDDDDDGDKGYYDMGIVRDKRGRRCESEKGNKAILAAKKLMAKLKKPSFMACMTKSCVNFNTMHLPNAFMRHMRETKPGQVQAVQLKISEKTWRVNVWNCLNNKTSKIYYRLGAGFGDFVQDNHVGRGDVCVFEAVDSPATIFKVTILRDDHHY